MMDGRICAISVLTLIALKTSLTRSEAVESDGSLDTPSDLDSRLQRVYDLLPADADDIDNMDKRRSLFRFGKRRSLFRFGKRGSILRFGKRDVPYDVEDFDINEYNPSDFYAFNEDPRAEVLPLTAKRSSLFRFGKKSRDTEGLFERNTEKDKKPHTPWRFGRYLERAFKYDKQ